MTEHAGVARVRGFLDAYERGDDQALGDYFTDDLPWHVAGTHPLSGDHRDKEALLDLFRAWRSQSVSLSAESVLASDFHTAAFTRVTGVRHDGRSLDVVLAHAFTVRSDGLWREYWVCADDQEAADAFWS